MTKKIHKFFEIFNLRGGPLMGLWTLSLIVKTLLGGTLDANVVRAYEIAIAAYAVSKANKMWVDKNNAETTTETTKIVSSPIT